ncbi:MAG: extracellular solute-binding protein [Clostridia bacterium]|nr:extracellular solute-binding protein [Clostridia bacterium]
MKRFLGITLAAALVVFGFAGCTGEEKSADEQGLTEITIWSPDSGSRTAMEKATYEFNETTGKENGIKVIYEAKESLSNQITIALQTNRAPDMFMSGDAGEFSEKGYIVAIDDLPGGKELIEKKKDFLVEKRQQYKGKTYSIPYNADTYGLLYNKDMFKAAGIVDENGEAKPPKTYAELREIAKKLTNPEKNEYGIIFPGKWGGWFGIDVERMASVNSGTVGYNYQDGTFDYSYCAPMMQLILDIKADGSCMPGTEGVDNDPARARFAEGNIGMKMGVSWDVGVLNDQFPAKCDWGVAPLPVADENNVYKQYLNVNTGMKISAQGVARVGAEKIMFVYSWFTSDELAKRLYELGAVIPIDSSIIESADSSNLKKGWAEFAAMTQLSVVYPQIPEMEIAGETDLSTNFLNNVWTGNMSIDEAIAAYNAVAAAGVEKYKEYNPDYDESVCIVPDWNIKR